jgi:hypothetical protein
MRSREKGFFLFSILIPLAVAAPSRAESSSPSYRLTQTTVNGGGGTSASPSGTAHRLSSSMGQESTIGVSSSFGFVLQGGFWSFQGTGLVPVLLSAAKNGAVPSHVDLSWTGNAPPYALYATSGCSNVTSGFLATSPTPAFTDTSPPPGSLACWSVFATAPGPIAPAGGSSPATDGSVTDRN